MKPSGTHPMTAAEPPFPVLLDLPAVADRLQVSTALVRKLARAAEYREKVLAGRCPVDGVPLDLLRYLDSGFPTPCRIGTRIVRVRETDLARWIAA